MTATAGSSGAAMEALVAGFEWDKHELVTDAELDVRILLRQNSQTHQRSVVLVANVDLVNGSRIEIHVDEPHVVSD